MTGMTDSYYLEQDGQFLPQVASRGPWDPNSLSGSAMVGLLAFAVERAVDTSDYMPARLTVDMYRLPDFSPVDIQARIVRDGYRIKVIDVEFVANGQSMARASCQLLRRTSNAEVRVWQPAGWDAPRPEALASPEETWGRRRRVIEGDMNQYGRKRMWLAEDRELVAGHTLSPFLRAALVADLTNPWANSGDGGLGYINSDVTLYLHRLPVDDWIGLDVMNHQATDGVAIAECWLHDRDGMIGSSSVTGLAQRKRPAGASGSGG